MDNVNERYEPTLINGALRMHDGRFVDVDTGEVYSGELSKVRNTQEIALRETAVMRRLHELPAPPQKLHPIAVVLYYRSVGITDEEICSALSIDGARLKALYDTDEYKEARSLLMQSLSEGDMQDVQALINTTAVRAAKRISDLVDDDDPELAMKASQDMLNRGGFMPVNKVQHNHKVSGGLNIKYITDDSDKNVIDISAEDV